MKYLLASCLTVIFNKNGEQINPKTTGKNRETVIWGFSEKISLSHKKRM